MLMFCLFYASFDLLPSVNPSVTRDSPICPATIHFSLSLCSFLRNLFTSASLEFAFCAGCFFCQYYLWHWRPGIVEYSDFSHGIGEVHGSV